MGWVKGVDASFDSLSLEEAKALKAAGVEVFAQCLWTGINQPAPRVINLRNAMEAGLKIVGYISVSPSRGGRQHVEAGRAGIPFDIWEALVQVPIDVELPNLNYQMHVLAALDATKELGKPETIYTSWHAWVELLGNPTHRQGTLLWNASWDDNEDIDYESRPYGLWTLEEVIGEQYSGGSLVEGVFVDRNMFRAEHFGITEDIPAPFPPTPWPTELEALRALANAGAVIAAGDPGENNPLAILSDRDKECLHWVVDQLD